MLNFFRKIPKPISGVLPDDRKQEDKDKDYLTKEIIEQPVQALQWEDFNNWKTRPEIVKMLADLEVNNQNGVGSCAAQAGSLALAINNYIEDKKFIKFSAKPIYARRMNKTERGMYMHDLGNICIKHGTVPEVLYPSPNDTEANMSNLDNYISAFDAIGKILKAKNYFWVANNIDAFANILSLGKPIVLAVMFGNNEWGNAIVPKIIDSQAKYGHAILALPNAYFTYEGKKAILIQDSWGTKIGYGGRRILTEDWFNSKRVMFGIWFEDINNLAVFNQEIKKPKLNLTRDLKVGDTGNDVKELQIALATLTDNEGYLFPITQKATGYFGGITRNAVQRYQKLRGLPITGIVDINTRKNLNNEFK